MTEDRPTHAELARTMAASASMGALSTIARDPAGYPFGSHVLCVTDDRGRPLMSLSDLAEHTRNAVEDPRAALLVTQAPADGADPLSGARLTLIGDLIRLEGDDVGPALELYAETHPGASYIRFPDFSFYRLEVRAVRFVGGFGTMSWVDAVSYTDAEPDPLAGFAAEVMRHMNDDHPDALIAYCRAFGQQPHTEAARMRVLDRYGFDVEATTPEGRMMVRVGFPEPVSTRQATRESLVRMVGEARSMLGSS